LADVSIGIIGYGIVGSGTYHILTDNADEIAARAGCCLRVAGIADIDWSRGRSVPVPPELRVADGAEIVNDPAIDIVVETIGGTGAALDFVLGAIRRGKSVVTSNKELIARHGAEILDAAAEAGVDVGFEGAVGGTIPICRALQEGLQANRFRRIIGILNGTTNYILTQMTEHGVEFGQALAEAQQKGFAEQDPSNDVDGVDASNKIAILSALAFRERVPVERIPREGIRQVTPIDIRYARELGCVIKLLAIAQRATNGGQLEVRVHPTFLPARHPLAAVSGEYNAVFVEGDASDSVMLYGKGAGSLPTGAAVVADVIAAARNVRMNCRNRIPCVCRGAADLKPIDQCATSHYIRMRVADQPGVLGACANILGEEGVSIKSVLQVDSMGASAEIVWLTHPGLEGKVARALERIRALRVVEQVAPPIRVEA